MVEAGTAQNLRGQGDSNHALDELTVTRLVDGEVSCTDSAPNEFGDVVCEAVFAEDGGEVQLEVKDPEGASAVDRITLTVEPPDDTEAPVAELTSPTADGVYYSDQPIVFFAGHTDAETDTADLVATFETLEAGDLTGSDVAVTTEGVVEATGMLESGSHTVRLMADGDGKEGTDSAIITVGPPNSTPDCTINAPGRDRGHPRRGGVL